MLKHLPVFIIFLLLSSCITIEINGNDYRSLTDAQKANLRKYPATYNKDSLGRLVQIKAGDILTTLDQQPYTWVHLWVPYCKGPNCKPLFYYDKIAQEHKNVRLFLVSLSYSPGAIEKAISRASFSENIYVLDDAHYGHKTRKAMLKFYDELLKNEGDTARLRAPSHMLFKGHKLVYYNSTDISGAQMDSIMHLN